MGRRDAGSGAMDGAPVKFRERSRYSRSAAAAAARRTKTAWAIATRANRPVWLADGMGGHPRASGCADCAADHLGMFQRQAKPGAEDVQSSCRALLAAHHQILRYATEKA